MMPVAMILAAAAALSLSATACGSSAPSSAAPSQPGQSSAWGPPGAPHSPPGEYQEEGQYEEGQYPEEGQHEGDYAGGGQYEEGQYEEGQYEEGQYEGDPAQGGHHPGHGIAEGETYPEPEAEPAAAPGKGPRRPGNQGGRGNAPRPAEPAEAEEAPPASKDMAALERAIVDEINRLRRNPRAYAASLQRYRGYYDGAFLRLPGNDIAIQTFEGVAAVDEAIAAAKRSKPLPELKAAAGLSRAARDHAKELGKAGTMDHSGKDGSSPFERMRRHGEMDGLAGENIGTAMHNRAEFSVIDLFVDDGVQGRGHRKNLLTPRYKFVGVGCAPHKAYGTICVMDFAEIYQDR